MLPKATCRQCKHCYDTKPYSFATVKDDNGKPYKGFNQCRFNQSGVRGYISDCPRHCPLFEHKSEPGPNTDFTFDLSFDSMPLSKPNCTPNTEGHTVAMPKLEAAFNSVVPPKPKPTTEGEPQMTLNPFTHLKRLAHLFLTLCMLYGVTKFILFTWPLWRWLGIRAWTWIYPWLMQGWALAVSLTKAINGLDSAEPTGSTSEVIAVLIGLAMLCFAVVCAVLCINRKLFGKK